MKQFSFFLLLFASAAFPVEAQQRDASCNMATELAIVVPDNSTDTFFVEVWHLDDFLQGLPAEPIYGYTTLPYDPPGPTPPSSCV